MQIVMTNPANGRKWRLRPYQNGLCLMIEKSPISKVNPKNGKEVTSEFVSCDRYPNSWPQGIGMILKMALMDTDDNDEIDFDSIDKAITGVAAAFTNKINDIMVEVLKDEAHRNH